MERKNGPWTIKKSSSEFKNDFIEVVEDEVIQPDGKDGKYAVVKMKPGVCILPMDDEGFVYLTKQFRYALGAESLEVPCGGMESDDALADAKREAKEELGIEADEWIDLGAMNIDTSIVKSPARVFLARKLKFTETEREGTETIKTVKMRFEEAVEKAASGEITHSPSCVTIFKAFMHVNKK